eukprot:Lankesteria_metandrocarpae@DN1881_c0_g1_i1.p1
MRSSVPPPTALQNSYGKRQISRGPGGGAMHVGTGGTHCAFKKMVMKGEPLANNIANGRKFLSLAIELDAMDMVYFLDNPATYGNKQLRAAMNSDVTAEFLNSFVGPF